MAYQIVVATNNTIQTVNVLGIDLTMNNPGVFKPLYSTIDQATANLKSLLLTRVGERYNQPTFGSQLLNILFQPVTDTIKIDINEIINEAVGFWLPYINIDDIAIVTGFDNPDLPYHIQITLTYSVNNYSTNTITLSATETGTIQIS
jgi:phage baseplate assembly protein W